MAGSWRRLASAIALFAIALAPTTPTQLDAAPFGSVAPDPDAACVAVERLRLDIAGICRERMEPPGPPTDRVLGTRMDRTDSNLSGGVMPAMGVQFHALWSDYTDQERVAVLDKLAAAGVEWVRIDLGWQSLQEEGGDAFSQWHVDRADTAIDLARARGISVLATLWATPAWANGGAGSHVPPTNVADYARVAGWAAEHFHGRVGAWEVWNEPNHPSFWSGTAEDYTELLKAAYPAFKAGSPSTPVVLGGPSYNDTDWLQKVYAAGGQGSFDVMATHPYQGISDTPPEAPDDGTAWRLSHVGAVHALMEEYGDGDKKIWFTEFGWSSHRNTGTEKNWARGVTDQQQADYLVRTLKYLKASHPYVTNVFWYNERNRDSGKVHMDNYGLLNRDLSEKPVYTAMRELLTGTSSPVEPDLIVTEPITLLNNGGFESGLLGWKPSKASASTTSDSRTGARAAKVVRRRDGYGISSAPLPTPVGSTVEAAGFLRAKRPAQTIRLLLIEAAGGTVIDRKRTRVTVGRQWEAFPQLKHTLSGRPDVTVQIKVDSNGQQGDVFFLDDISLMVSG